MDRVCRNRESRISSAAVVSSCINAISAASACCNAAPKGENILVGKLGILREDEEDEEENDITGENAMPEGR